MQQTDRDLGAYAAQLAALAQDINVDRSNQIELNAVASQLTDVAAELRGPERKKPPTKTKDSALSTNGAAELRTASRKKAETKTSIVEPETSVMYVISDARDNGTEN